LQVLSFTCPYCFFVSRLFLCRSCIIIYWYVFCCHSSINQWCLGNHMQRNSVWHHYSLEANIWWQKGDASCCCPILVPPSLVLHFSLLYGCCIRYCSAGYVSCKFEKELLVKCIGKVYLDFMLQTCIYIDIYIYFGVYFFI